MAWTESQKREICRMFYADGLSASQVASQYGVTRQSIIGIIHRNSAAFGHERKGHGAKTSPRRTKASSPRLTQAWSPPRPPAPRLPRLEPAPASVEAPSLSLPFDDLGTTRCQFATTPHHVAPADHRFCGHPVETGRWCGFHARLAYAPPSERRWTSPRGHS